MSHISLRTLITIIIMGILDALIALLGNIGAGAFTFLSLNVAVFLFAFLNVILIVFALWSVRTEPATGAPIATQQSQNTFVLNTKWEKDRRSVLDKIHDHVFW